MTGVTAKDDGVCTNVSGSRPPLCFTAMSIVLNLRLISVGLLGYVRVCGGGGMYIVPMLRKVWIIAGAARRARDVASCCLQHLVLVKYFCCIRKKSRNVRHNKWWRRTKTHAVVLGKANHSLEGAPLDRPVAVLPGASRAPPAFVRVQMKKFAGGTAQS